MKPVVLALGTRQAVANAPGYATIVGLPQLDLAFIALQARLNLAAPTALQAAGGTIEERWKALVPVQDGNYKRAISTEVESSPFGARGSIAVRHLDNLVAHTAHPENEQPYLYASRLEYGGPGTVTVYGKAQVSAVWRAHPSARPAFDEKKDEAVNKAATRVLAAAALFGTR